MPASRVDNVSHAGLLEEGARIRLPWSAEVVGARGDILTVLGSHSAVVDDVVRVAGGGVTARGGDGAVGCCEDADVDLVEPCLEDAVLVWMLAGRSA